MSQRALRQHCPCGAELEVETDQSGCTVMHAVPMCDEFERRDVDDFLEYVQAWRERELVRLIKAGVRA